MSSTNNNDATEAVELLFRTIGQVGKSLYNIIVKKDDVKKYYSSDGGLNLTDSKLRSDIEKFSNYKYASYDKGRSTVDKNFVSKEKAEDHLKDLAKQGKFYEAQGYKDRYIERHNEKNKEPLYKNTTTIKGPDNL